MKTTFNLEATTDDEGTAILRLQGDLDLLATPDFREHLSRIVPTAPRLVIDLTGVEFIDSAGMGLLCSALKRMRSNEKDCQFVGAQGQPLRLLQISGLAGTVKHGRR